MPVRLYFTGQTEVGREVAIPRHLQDGEESDLPLSKLLSYGKKLFEAHFTVQEGAGVPSPKEPERRSASSAG